MGIDITVEPDAEQRVLGYNHTVVSSEDNALSLHLDDPPTVDGTPPPV